MTKPTTKSPAERRLRKDIRPLLQAHKAGTITEDQAVRELLALIDDEVRRTRMSMPFRASLDGDVSSWYKDAATWVDKPPYLTSGGNP